MIIPYRLTNNISEYIKHYPYNISQASLARRHLKSLVWFAMTILSALGLIKSILDSGLLLSHILNLGGTYVFTYLSVKSSPIYWKSVYKSRRITRPIQSEIPDIKNGIWMSTLANDVFDNALLSDNRVVVVEKHSNNSIPYVHVHGTTLYVNVVSDYWIEYSIINDGVELSTSSNSFKQLLGEETEKIPPSHRAIIYFYNLSRGMSDSIDSSNAIRSIRWLFSIIDYQLSLSIAHLCTYYSDAKNTNIINGKSITAREANNIDNICKAYEEIFSREEEAKFFLLGKMIFEEPTIIDLDRIYRTNA